MLSILDGITHDINNNLAKLHLILLNNSWYSTLDHYLKEELLLRCHWSKHFFYFVHEPSNVECCLIHSEVTCLQS